jgi:DNA-directed RNA polymerase subunit RPC12/RpoP
MNEPVSFICKNCGSQSFIATSKPETLKDFDGIPCSNCGTPFSEEEIKKQARKIAENLIRDAFKEGRF